MASYKKFYKSKFVEKEKAHDSQRKAGFDALILKRFLSKVKKDKNGCWNWMAGKNGEGYGYFKINGVGFRSHRLSYSWFIGSIPKGKLACHLCDNRACVNPHHLFLGSFKDNTQDMIKKGRNAKGYSRPNQLGSNNIKSKLSLKDVISIRNSFKLGDRKFGAGSLGRKYKVSDVAILRIVKRESWSHV